MDQEDLKFVASRVSDDADKEIQFISARRATSRKHLYWVSLACIAIVTTGAVPQKIEAVGVTFSSFEQRKGMLLLAAAVAYFMVDFIRCSWQMRLLGKVMKAAIAPTVTDYLEHFPEEFARVQTVSYRLERVLFSLFSSSFEFLLPMATGGLAIALALGWARPG
jgi:hypothetical protein